MSALHDKLMPGQVFCYAGAELNDWETGTKRCSPPLTPAVTGIHFLVLSAPKQSAQRVNRQILSDDHTLNGQKQIMVLRE